VPIGMEAGARAAWNFPTRPILGEMGNLALGLWLWLWLRTRSGAIRVLLAITTPNMASRQTPCAAQNWGPAGTTAVRSSHSLCSGKQASWRADKAKPTTLQAPCLRFRLTAEKG